MEKLRSGLLNDFKRKECGWKCGLEKALKSSKQIWFLGVATSNESGLSLWLTYPRNIEAINIVKLFQTWLSFGGLIYTKGITTQVKFVLGAD